MNALKNVIQYLSIAVILGVSSYALYTQAKIFLTPPCTEPVRYSVGSIDPKYHISQNAFASAIRNAAAVWNKELGKELFVYAPEGELPVSLIYTKEQENVNLGKIISAEQEAFDSAKARLDSLKTEFDSLQQNHNARVSAFNARAAAYEESVASWNAKGGAPPSVFESLKEEQLALKVRQQELNQEVDALNALAGQINNAVSVLNEAARKINSKVSTYNQGAGEDFEQGKYKKDSTGASITINEFKNTGDLTRVLAHEFGHALGLDHVENPASIMFSYNIGSDLVLSEEDIMELKRVCKLK